MRPPLCVSLTMSQWIWLTFVPPISATPFPRATCAGAVDLLVEERVLHVACDARVAADAELADAPRTLVQVEHLE